MDTDTIDEDLIQVIDDQDDYVQILGVSQEEGMEDTDITSLGVDDGTSVFIDIDAESETDDMSDSFSDSDIQ